MADESNSKRCSVSLFSTVWNKCKAKFRAEIRVCSKRYETRCFFYFFRSKSHIKWNSFRLFFWIIFNNRILSDLNCLISSKSETASHYVCRNVNDALLFQTTSLPAHLNIRVFHHSFLITWRWLIVHHWHFNGLHCGQFEITNFFIFK